MAQYSSALARVCDRGQQTNVECVNEYIRARSEVFPPRCRPPLGPRHSFEAADRQRRYGRTAADPCSKAVRRRTGLQRLLSASLLGRLRPTVQYCLFHSKFTVSHRRQVRRSAGRGAARKLGGSERVSAIKPTVLLDAGRDCRSASCSPCPQLVSRAEMIRLPRNHVNVSYSDRVFVPTATFNLLSIRSVVASVPLSI